MSSGTDTKEQIRRATDIVDLVGSYYPLRRAGANYVCHCPWHDDNRPSLQINPARQSWVCWVCDIRGDVFDFVMRKEGVEFFDAMKLLAERAGISISLNQKKAVKGSPNDKQTLYGAMRWATERFNSYLQESQNALIARDYLKKRGFEKEIIDKFRIGFAPLKWSWLADQSSSTEFSLEVLAACDLISRSDQGSGYFERFRGRLIFPIFDTMGRPIAIGGRLIPGVDLESPAKYVNSRETRLFSKSETLYGLNFVKDFVSKTRSLTVVEGYTDVIASWQAGIQDVVACLGTALNEKHIRLIKRFADRITLVLDGDDAGRRRANEVVDLFVANDVDLRILTLPDNQDPMEFVRSNGAEAFQNLANNAVDAIGHKIQIETEGVDVLNDTHRANAALERILETLAKTPPSLFTGATDKVLRQDQLLSRLARKFGVERTQLKTRLVELRSKNRQHASDPTAETLTRFDSLLRHEAELIQLILGNPDFLDTVVENIAGEQFVEGPLKELYERIDQGFQNGDEISFENLMLLIEEPQQKSLLVYLNDQWHQKTVTQKDHLYTPGKMLDETLKVFTNLELESGKQRKINELQNSQLDEKQELSTLEELLNQARQQHGL